MQMTWTTLSKLYFWQTIQLGFLYLFEYCVLTTSGESRRSYTAASISCFSAENGRPCHGSGDVANGSSLDRRPQR